MKTIQFPKWKSVSLCLVMLTLLLSSVSATTFYISPSGNDATGTGTAANPWRSLYKATATVAGNGDIIHVNAGTYIETLQCLLKPGVSIEGDGVSSVIQSTLTADWQAILVASSPEGTNGNQHIANLKFDGQNLTNFWGIYVGGRSNVSMYNCTVENFKDRGIIFGGRNDNLDGAPFIYATGNSFHHNIVNNCAAYNTPNGIYGRGCLNIGGQEGMLIYNNTITQNQRPDGFNGWPIKAYNDGHINGVKIYNNTLIKIRNSATYPGENGWDFAIELFNESGLEIYGNTIQGSIDMNFQSKGAYPYSVYIHDNIIGQPVLNPNYESAIIFEFDTETAIVENNIINNVAGGVLFNTRNLSQVSNITIQKNLFSNIGRGVYGNGNNGVGVGFYTEGTDNATITNVAIHNNTFVAAPGNAPFFGLLVNCIATGTMTNLSIKNNIFQGFYNTWFRAAAANNINTLVINNNNLYLNAQSNAVDFTGTPANYITAGNTNNNPLFVSPTNFQLQSASPLIDAGVYVGLPYVGAAPDKGYAEYSSAIANTPPTAFAGADQNITLPVSTINLIGSGIDPDGTITTYLWTKVAGPAATITNPNVAATTVTALVQGTYLFELKVTDNNGATAADTIQLIVNPAVVVNLPPTANAGANQNITLPTNNIALAGSGIDPDGTITTYLWTKVAGPAATITNANVAATTVTALVAGIYKFELRVTDNSGAVGKDTVQVIVFAPNIAPTANAGLNQSITLPTNTANLNGTGNDTDGTITAFKWTKIAGPASSLINNSNAAVATVTALTAGVYQFELRVTDNSGAIGKDTMQVTVNPENIAPTANAGSDQSLVLPSNKVTLSGSGTDVDGTITGFTWKQISGPVDKLTSTNTAITVLDNLIEGNYKFELTVTDNRGATGKDTVGVTIAAAVVPSQSTMQIYPNPVIDFATVDISNTKPNSTLLLNITDIQGKVVFKKQIITRGYSTREKINMNNFAQGIYFVTVNFSSKEKLTLTILKQ